MTGIFSAPPLGTLVPPAHLKPLSAGGRRLLDALLRRRQMSQSELPTTLGMSQPSIARLVSGFADDDMVRVSARAATGRGNPSVTLALNADYASALGIGIFGDAVSVAIVDFAGEVRAQRRVPMRHAFRSAVLAELPSLVDELLKETSIPRERLVGAGVGFSGFVAGSPLRFNPPEKLADWVDADVPALVSEVLGLHVIADNDATAGAIAEALLGTGRTCGNFAYCHLTNGFGGGLIADGHVVRGNLANAGDFGGIWWLLDQGYPNLDLLYRCVADGGDRFASVEDMLQSLRSDMPGVDAWLSVAIKPFASLSFILGHSCAPEKVVIGGRIPGWLARMLAERIVLPQSPARNAQPFALPEVVARQIDGDAVAIGGAVMVLQQLYFA